MSAVAVGLLEKLQTFLCEFQMEIMHRGDFLSVFIGVRTSKAEGKKILRERGGKIVNKSLIRFPG